MAIAAKTGWRRQSVPEIKIASEQDLAVKLFGTPEGLGGILPKALYDRGSHILYLSNKLTFATLLERSILLHEMVHHMQVINNVESGCREEAEARGYELQAQWLRENGIADPYGLIGISERNLEALQCL